MKLSPMMEQYLETKAQYPDCILFYRLGDFYEMFFDDAKTVSRELELVLTGRNCGLEERAPMCGVPFHSADSYLTRLVEKGYKVAICEQMEDPQAAKGLVKREVVRIVTPGTLTAEGALSEKENNYLAALFLGKETSGLAYCDLSTGELAVTECFQDGHTYANLVNELVKLRVREILVGEQFQQTHAIQELKNDTGAYVNVLSDSVFSEKGARELIAAQLGRGGETASGLGGRTSAVQALGGLLSYLRETQKQALPQFTTCRFYEVGGHMSLDKATLRNLEITETLYEKRTQGSLLGVLDKTCTAMGSRLMKRWLREPLNQAQAVNQRLDAVSCLVDQPLLLNDLREQLKQIYDFERLAGRIASGSANGKDLLALQGSLSVIPQMMADLEEGTGCLLAALQQQMDPLEDLAGTIQRTMAEDPPYTIKEGGLIREGASAELDQLKASIADAKAWIAGLEGRERERTGIKTLKVGYNKVFGYYLDVTRANASLVPEEYIRKQTLVNNERYITPELKEMESLVLGAETKIHQMEYELFCQLRQEAQGHIRSLQQTAEAVAILDVLAAFAYVAGRNGYVRPEVDNSDQLSILRGRHPVIEQTEEGGRFVSNDTYLNGTDASLMVLTGPNMSGKSTFMRQTALIVLMAQIGSFVPADQAHIGIVDRIFTRIGASDNLSQGQSTFYVEMSELSYILGCATPRSLIILDEIGRGTSTYDGLAIAWACVDYLAGENRHIRTLFATHYHELTSLEGQLSGVKNLNVEVSEEAGEILFLHRIVPGSASRSYGIHVARLAGVPPVLLTDAEEKLARLEANGAQAEVRFPDPAPQQMPLAGENQLSFFAPGPADALIQRIQSVDLYELKASDAIGILEELKGIIS